MANWFISSAKYALVAPFAINTVYAVGALIRQLTTPTVGNERVFRCTTAGTSAATEPAWNVAQNGTTASGTCVFTEVTGQATYNWSAPFARMIGTWGTPSTDLWFIGNDHNETRAATATLNGGTATAKRKFICVDVTKTSPTPADYTTGATISVTGNFAFATNANGYFYGITFCFGSGATSAQNSISNSGGSIFENCTFKTLGAFAHQWQLSQLDGRPHKMINCKFSFSLATQSFNLGGGTIIFEDTDAPFPDTKPTVFMNSGAAYSAHAYFRGCDFSAASGMNLSEQFRNGKVIVEDCALPSGSLALGGINTMKSYDYHKVGADSATLTSNLERISGNGTVTTETSLVRDAGATDGVTNYSHKYVSLSYSFVSRPLDGIQFSKWNTVLNTNITVTIHGIWSSTTVPTTEEIYAELTYLGDATSRIGTFLTTRPPSPNVGTAVSASTESWGKNIATRTNSEVVILGTMRKVSGNPGRVFICTTAGTCSASLPAGYATAVDGGSVTDGSAVFRAMVRFKISFSLTSPQPQLAGDITVLPRVGTSSTTLYICPKMEIS